MKIIISPAKKMEECGDIFAAESEPKFLGRTKLLYGALAAMDEPELKKLFGANDQITHQNFLRYQAMDLDRARTPALLSYVGIQYQYMAPKLFSYEQWEYVRNHLRILSGFYGILRPEDRVTPYRLEMQAKLSADGKKDLYGFWGDSLYRSICEEEAGSGGVIVNLASKEYSKAIEPYLTPSMRYVTCVFGVMKDGKVRTKATEAKMARGEMVRYMAENGIEDVERIREFSALGYCYREDLSSPDCFTYIKAGKEKAEWDE